MKTILKFTTATAFMFVTVTGTATESIRTDMVPPSDTEIEILESADKGKRIFRQKGKKVYLNILNLAEDTIEIKVFDSSKRVLFKEVIEGDLTVEKAFNFEQAVRDSYTVAVKDSEGTYLERISVK